MVGRSGQSDAYYVNTTTGNLILRSQDEVLVSLGLDLALVRTYNSQGLVDGDNNDGWRLGVYRRLHSLTGTLNSAGSTITKVFGDGAESLFTYDAARSLYVSTEGEGAHDTLAFNSVSSEWTYSDGSSLASEVYDASGRLLRVVDADGNATVFTYSGSLLSEITDAAGQTTYLDYVGNNLSQVRVVSSAVTQTLTRYTYDTQNRLTEVRVDLSPSDNSIADGATYLTLYTYDGTSTRIASITHADSTTVAFTYEEAGGQYRIKTVTDGEGKATTFTYLDATHTEISDPLGLVTTYVRDATGRLTQVLSPAVEGIRFTTTYSYDTAGNLTAVTDARNQTTVMEYDARGNLTLTRDAAGNTATRTYSSTNQLLTETIYLVPDPDGAGAGQPSAPVTARYVYDSEGHLRFTVSAEGRVSEQRYAANGNRTATIAYTGGTYDLSALAATDSLSETQLTTWVSTQNLAKTERTDYDYDFRGQVITATTYAIVNAGGAGVGDGTHSVTRFIYDQRGRLLQTIDARGETTADPNDYVTSYTYDGLGRLLTTTQWVSATETRTTTTTYDDAGNRVLASLQNGLTTTSVFDRRGLLLSVSHAASAQALGTTQYQYDAAGRLRIAIDPLGNQTHRLYDEAGRVVAVIDATGALIETVYDNVGNAVKVIRYANRLSSAQFASLIDGSGNPTNVTLASVRPLADSTNDRVTRSLYDNANRAVMQLTSHDSDANQAYIIQTFYDGAGRMTDVIAYGNAISLAGLPAAPTPADISARITTASDDRHTRRFYDGEGRLIATLDAEGFLTESRYSAAGELVETIGRATATDIALRVNGTLTQLRASAGTHPDDQHTHRFHNAKGEFIASLDAEGYLTEYAYDVAGNQTQSLRYYNKANAYSGTETLAQLRPSAHVNDQVTVSAYNGANQIMELTTNPSGTVTRFIYDNVGHLIQTDKAWNTAEVRTTRARYDAKGQVLQELTAEGSAAVEALLITNPSATPAEIDALWGQYSLTHSYDLAGRRVSTNDQNGNQTLFYYDEAGRLSYTINALGEVVALLYNSFGNVTDRIRYTNRVSMTDLVGGIITSDVLTRVTGISQATGDTADSHVHYNYTLRGALKEAIEASATPSRSQTLSQTYNTFGELQTKTTQLTDVINRIDRYTHDKRGLLTQTTEDETGLNRINSRHYDAFGRLTQTSDARGVIRTQTYDKLGRQLIVTTDPTGLNLQTQTTYDAFSRVLTQQDARGNTTTFAYNDINRSFTITTSEGVSATTQTNRHGETVSVTDGRGITTTYTYDKNGNLKTSVVDGAGLNLTSQHTYDRANREIESIDARGTKTTYIYDAANRLIVKTLDPIGLNLRTTYSYDGQGRTLTVTEGATTPEASVTQTTYDAKGQVKSISVDPTGLNLTTRYTYDNAGRTVTVTDGAGTPEAKTTQYLYDHLDRRLEEIKDPGGLNIRCLYTYDANDNVTSKTEAAGTSEAVTTRYVYDNQNRPTYTVDALGGVSQHEYDRNGNVVQATRYATVIGLTGLGDTITAADIATRLTPDAARDEVTRYAHDRDNRLIFTRDVLNQITEKVYDANSNVIKTIAYATPLAAGTANAVEAIRNAVSPHTQDRTSRSVFDAANRAVYTIDALGYVKETQYDATGNVIATKDYGIPITLAALSATPTVAEIQAALATPLANATVATQSNTTTAQPQPYTNVDGAKQDVSSATTEQVAVQVSNNIMGNAGFDIQSQAAQLYGGATDWNFLGDYNGDGKTDFASWNSASTIKVNLSTGTGFTTEIWNGEFYSGATAWNFVGDYNGDGKTDILGWDTASTVKVNLSSGAGFTTQIRNSGLYGGATSWNFRGDFNGDKVTDIASWESATSIRINAARILPVLAWSTANQPSDSTVSFRYRRAGSTDAYTDVVVNTIDGHTNKVDIGAVLAGDYELEITYKDSFGRALKTGNGVFTARANGVATVNTTFTYSQVTSTAVAGSSISGYIQASEVASIDYIEANVFDTGTSALVSTALTYPEFESNYAGNVNLKVGSPLSDGRYNVAIAIHYKNGTIVNRPIIPYEIGQRTTTVSWNQTAPANTHVEFRYTVPGETASRLSLVSESGGQSSVTLSDLATGSYQYTIQYRDNATLTLVREAKGSFTVTVTNTSASAPLPFGPSADAPLLITTQYAYDAAGRLIQTTDAEGFSEYYGYDALGNKTSFTNKKGAVAGDVAYTWHYTYDKAGRLTEERTPQVEVARLGTGSRTETTPLSQASSALIASGRLSGGTVYVGDFNGDGVDEILWYNTSSGENRLFTKNGAGNYVEQTNPILPGYINNGTLLIGDYNGDGIDDILWHDPVSGNQGLLINNGAGSFTRTVNPISAGLLNAGNLYVGDFNGDGRDDLFWHRPASGIQDLYISNGSGGFTRTTSPLASSDVVGGSIYVGDVNGDGRSEILWYNPTTGNTNLFVNQPNGSFTKVQNVIAPAHIGNGTLAVGDLNGDGTDDLVWYNTASGNAKLFHASAATFASTPIARNFTAGGNIQFGDFNGDNVDDAVVVNGSSGANDWTLSSSVVVPTTESIVTTESITTRITYDALGNVKTRTEAYGAPEARTTTYVYDAVGRQIQTLFPAIGVYNASADQSANYVGRNESTVTPSSTTYYDVLGRAYAANDVKGAFSYKVYDTLGRVKYEIDAERYVSEYTYDAFGNQLTLTRYATALAEANFTAREAAATTTVVQAVTVANVQAWLTVNAAQDRTIANTYDRLDRVTETKQPATYTFDSTANQYFTAAATTRNTYNAFGQVIKQSNLRNLGADNTANTADDQWIDTYFYFNHRGEKTAEVNALDFLTAYQYDAEGNLTETTEYAQALTPGSWNTSAFGTPAVTTPTDANSISAIGFDRMTRYAYDRLNRKTEETKVNVQYTDATYGGTTTVTARLGNLISRLSYDAVGNLVSTTDPTGATTFVYYDVLGRAIATAEPGRLSESAGSTTLPPLFVSTDLLSWDISPVAGTVALLRYRVVGASAWIEASTANGLITVNGSRYNVNLSGKPNDIYEYSLSYSRSGEGTTYAQGTGRFSITRQSSVGSTNVVANAEEPSLDLMGTTSASYYADIIGYDESGNPQYGSPYWHGSSSVRLSWSSFSAWGNGDVKVTVDYRNHANNPNSRTQTFNSASSLTGATVSWGGEGLNSVSRIRVWKVVDGQDVLLYDTTGDFTGSERLILKGNTAGLTGIDISGIGSRSVTLLGNGIYAVDISDLARGNYGYTPVGSASLVGGNFQVQGSQSLAPTAPAFQESVLSLDLLGTTSASYYADIIGYDESGNPQYGSPYWHGTSTVSLRWSPLDQWGAGDVSVTVDYRNHANNPNSRTQTFNSASSLTGATVSWGGEGLNSVSRIRVWKAVDGQNVLVHDTTGSTSIRRLQLSNLPSASASAVFEYRKLGSTDPYLAAATPLKTGAGWFAVAYDDIANGAYEYRLTVKDASGNVLDLTSLGGSTQGQVTGTFQVKRGGQSLPTMASGASAMLTPLTTMRRDVFGNLVQEVAHAKGAASADAEGFIAAPADAVNDQQRFTFYDLHGHVIRTIDAEGISKYVSYDTAGSVAKQWSTQTDTDGRTQQVSAIYRYDRLGHQTATEEVAVQTASPISAPVLVTSFSLTITNTASASYYADQIGTDESGNPIYGDPYWHGSNSVSLSWPSLADWGTGDVKVTLGYNGSQTRTHTFSSAASLTGATLSWGGEGLSSVNRLRVYKVVDGQEVLLADTPGNMAAKRLLAWQSSPVPGAIAVLRYRPQGSTGAWSEATTANGGLILTGSRYLFTASALADDAAFDYEITHTRPGAGTAYIAGKGSFTNAIGWTNTASALTTLSVDRKEARYNGFGEITAKGLNGGWQEYFSYDKAGYLWQTNQGDGIDKVYLYDLQGHATADIRSASLDLRAYTDPSLVGSLTNVRRTQTQYDALGRSIEQAQASFNQTISPDPIPGTLLVSAFSLTITNTASASYYADQIGTDESGNPIYGDPYWHGSNSVSLSWPSLADWGTGDVKVTLGYNGSQTRTHTFSSAASLTGATLSWGGEGLSSVNRLRVYKVVDGQEVLLADTPGNMAAKRLLAWQSSPIPGVSAVLRYRAAGSSEAWTEASLANGGFIQSGSRYLFNATALTDAASYDYQITYTRAGEAVLYAAGQGSFTNTVGWSAAVGTAPTVVTITPTIRQTLDRWGNVLSVNDPRNTQWMTNYRYNYANQTLEEVKPETDIWTESGLSQRNDVNTGNDRPTTRYHYDALGHQIALIDANGRANGSRYDEAGQLIAEHHADGGVAKSTYDTLGRKIACTDANGNVTTYTYNRNDLLVKEQLPLGSSTYTYDEAGHRLSVTNGLGETTRYFYDARGNVVMTRLPLGGTNVNTQYFTTATYDALGRKIAEGNGNSDIQSWTYDYFGKLTAYTDLGAASHTYTYNRSNQVLSTTNTRGQNLSHEYYENGWLKKITDNAIAPAPVASGQASLIGSTLTKTGPTGWGNAGAMSQNAYVGRAYVSATVGQTNLHGMFGLNADPQTDNNYASLDYAWYATPGGALSIYENGNHIGNFGSYTTTDVLSIEYDGADIRYMQNGVVKRTVATTAGRSLYFDAALYDSGFTFNNVQWRSFANSETFYEYDTSGQRTRERFKNLDTNEVYQDVRTSYDELGRVTRLNDNRYTMQYYYDAVGNRRRTLATYFDNQNQQQTKNYWYTYDAMNRITLSQGVLQSGVIQKTTAQGIELAYDAGGNRRTASFYESGSLIQEAYNYDAHNRLTNTNRGGLLTSARTYDLASRVTEYVSYSSPGTIKDRQVSTYNANGWSLKQESYNSSNQLTQTIRHDYTDSYDAAGNVLKYTVQIHQGSGYTNTYTKEYAKFGSYKERVVHGTSTYFSAGDTTETYDVNGNLIRVEDRFNTNKNRDFIVNTQGQILQKRENGQTDYYYYADGNPVGSTGNIGGANADFDYNYTPVSASYPGTTPSNYTVSQGDTLKGIALAVYGDAKLWYLIADANGLRTDSDLQVGQTLTIPNKISNLHNDYTTHKVYAPGEIIGDTTPTLPEPPPLPPPPQPKKGKCGGFGAILMVIVAVVVTIFTAGAAAAALGVAANSFAAVAIGAAAGSIASQLVGMATGVVDKFSWKQVALAGISGGVGAGVSAGMSVLTNGMNATAASVLTSVASNVVNQGVNILTGQQEKFNWKSVAMAAVAPVAKSAGETVGGWVGGSMSGAFGETVGKLSGDIANKFTSGVVTQGLTVLIQGKGKVEYAKIAADAFGNVLGNALADKAKSMVGDWLKDKFESIGGGGSNTSGAGGSVTSNNGAGSKPGFFDDDTTKMLKTVGGNFLKDVGGQAYKKLTGKQDRIDWGGAAANAIAPTVAKYIGDKFNDDKGSLGHMLSHGLLGAGVASLRKQDAWAGAIGGMSSVWFTNTFGDGLRGVGGNKMVTDFAGQFGSAVANAFGRDGAVAGNAARNEATYNANNHIPRVAIDLSPEQLREARAEHQGELAELAKRRDIVNRNFNTEYTIFLGAGANQSWGGGGFDRGGGGYWSPGKEAGWYSNDGGDIWNINDFHGTSGGSYGVEVGVVFGGPDVFAGTFHNYHLDLGPVGFTYLFSDTYTPVGFSLGFGAGAGYYGTTTYTTINPLWKED